MFSFKKHQLFVNPKQVGLVLVLFLLLTGCANQVQLPEVDLSAPDWTVWTGQALWQAKQDRPALAGEILLAQHKNGDVLINFSKPPVPIFTAQTGARQWKIDFIDQQRAYSGTGRPPSRFIWFVLPAMLQGAPPPQDWQIETEDKYTWLLNNPTSGERIRLSLDV